MPQSARGVLSWMDLLGVARTADAWAAWLDAHVQSKFTCTKEGVAAVVAEIDAANVPRSPVLLRALIRAHLAVGNESECDYAASWPLQIDAISECLTRFSPKSRPAISLPTRACTYPSCSWSPGILCDKLSIVQLCGAEGGSVQGAGGAQCH